MAIHVIKVEKLLEADLKCLDEAEQAMRQATAQKMKVETRIFQRLAPYCDEDNNPKMEIADGYAVFYKEQSV